MPRIRILATGGTIAGASDPAGDGARYVAGVVDVDRLVGQVTGLSALAQVDAAQVLALDSKDMTPGHWQVLRPRICDALRDPGVDGVVILHGTDTLEETAWFLHLTLPADKPVVLTGAMRPADHPQADGPANIVAAVSHAAAGAPGVRIVLNGGPWQARELVKARTLGLDAFSAGASTAPLRGAGCFAHLDNAALPRVDILPGYAGAPADLIDACVTAGARGLVLALAGHGSVPAAWVPALRRARNAGVRLLRASRCAGPVVHNGNADDDGEGYLTAGDLPPLKARIALMLALADGMSFHATGERLATL